MPSKGRSKPATEVGLKKLETALKGNIEVVRAELKGDIAAVKSEFNKKIDRVAVEVIKTREEMATKSDIAGIQKQLGVITDVLNTY